MKILFVSDTYYPQINGVYYFVCRVGPMLQNKGHEIAVIVPSENMTATFKKLDDLDVYGMPSLPVLYYPNIRFPIAAMLKSRLRKIIEQFKPDIIHLQDHFLISKAVVELNKELKIPIIGTNHFMPENITILVKGQKWKQRIENFLWKGFSEVYNQVKLVTTPTETGVAIIRSKLKVDTVAISSGIDLSLFNPIGDTSSIKEKYKIPDKPVLLYVGRLDPEKHIEEILESVAIAIKQIDFCFVIVGKGIRKAMLEKLTEDLGISEHVIFTGFVPDEDLPYFYKLGRIFIIASIAELLSLAALQAMASGLPIIAVKAAALVELVQDGENGYLYEEGNIPAIVQAISNIVTDEPLYRKMSQKSIELVQKHDILRTLESFENLYHIHSGKN